MKSLNAALPILSNEEVALVLRINQFPRRSSDSHPYTSGTSGHFAMLRATMSSMGDIIARPGCAKCRNPPVVLQPEGDFSTSVPVAACAESPDGLIAGHSERQDPGRGRSGTDWPHGRGNAARRGLCVSGVHD